MPKIKICGITNAKDALLACASGADALGFVFVPDSPRFITPSRAAAIIATLPPFVTTLGVFADALPEKLRRICLTAGVQIAQLHGSESSEYCQKLGIPYVKTIHVGKKLENQNPHGYGAASALLLDTCCPDASGGTGRTFDWKVVESMKVAGRVILAGGLHAKNVSEAIRVAQPYAVDVCSGVESEPGRKDPEKLRAFCGAVKSEDGRCL